MLIHLHQWEDTDGKRLKRGESIPSCLPSKPDIILAADCVYFEPAFPLLVQTLAELSDPTTQVLFCYKKRRKVRFSPDDVVKAVLTIPHSIEPKTCRPINDSSLSSRKSSLGPK